MKDLLGVKEEDDQQNQREKTAYVTLNQKQEPPI
jgi:hypothetical protein